MTSRTGRGMGNGLLVGLLVGSLACAGSALERGETDTNTNWLERCEEGDSDCSRVMTDLEIPAAEAQPDVGEPTESAHRRLPESALEAGSVDSCVVPCNALLSGAECGGGAQLPSLNQTLAAWQNTGCGVGSLLVGHCAGGTRFLWRGGETSEVRYFTAAGAFIGLSAFLSMPDASTCNGVRRWPQQVECEAPTVSHELCATLPGAMDFAFPGPDAR